MVINWGSTVPATWLSDPRFRLRPKWVNAAEAVSRAIDKGKFFDALRGRDDIPVIRATTDIKEAQQWLKKDFGVVVRKTLTGSGGAGIVVVRPGDGINALPKAPLYTRYYPKTHEFRCHIWNGQVIDFVQKKLKGGPNASANRSVRNLDNGWIYAHDDLSLVRADIDVIGQACAQCIRALGLYFGAVDVLAILKDGHLDSFRICEVNTGPGLENTQTINAYKQAILKEKH